MLMATRIAFWIQLLLGLGLARLFTGSAPSEGERTMHMVVGIVAALLALYTFRPGTGAPSNGLTTAAAFFPLVPLILGLLIRSGTIGDLPTIGVHAVLGLAAVGLIEAASGRRRRLARANAPT
jgi:hypothetical protein